MTSEVRKFRSYSDSITRPKINADDVYFPATSPFLNVPGSTNGPTVIVQVIPWDHIPAKPQLPLGSEAHQRTMAEFRKYLTPRDGEIQDQVPEMITPRKTPRRRAATHSEGTTRKWSNYFSHMPKDLKAAKFQPCSHQHGQNFLQRANSERNSSVKPPLSLAK